MKKLVFISLLILTLIVTACGANSSDNADQQAALEQAEAGKAAAEEAAKKAAEELEALKAEISAASEKASAEANAAKAEADAAKAEADKAAAEKAAAELALAEAKTAEEKAAAEKALAEKTLADKEAQEAARIAAEKAAEKAAAEKVAAEKAAADKAAAEQAAAEKAAAEKAAAEKAAGEKKLTVWLYKTFSPTADSMVVERIQQFAKENNVEITVEIIPTEQLQQKYAAAIEAGTTPDIGLQSNTSIIPYLDKGLLLDINQAIQTIEKNNGPFIKASVDYVSKNSETYAVPLFNNPYVMHYRKDLLAKAGYTSPPKTWAEFREVAKKITETSPGVYGAGIVLGNADDGEVEQRSLSWSYGVRFNTADGKTPTISSTQQLLVMKMITDMYLVDKSIPPGSISWNNAGNNTCFLTGQCAMIFNPPTVYNASQAANADPVVKANVALAPLPAGPNGSIVNGNTIYLAAFKSTKAPETSKKLLAYMLDKSFYPKILTTVAPVYAPVLVNLKDDQLWQNPINKPALEAANSFRYNGFPGPGTTAASFVFSNHLIMKAYQRILVDKITPESALIELEKEYNKAYGVK